MTDDWTGWTAKERAAEERQRIRDAEWAALGTMKAVAVAGHIRRDARRKARLVARALQEQQP